MALSSSTDSAGGYLVRPQWYPGVQQPLRPLQPPARGK